MHRYANSDLGEFRDSLFSFKTKKPSTPALALGTLFHSLVLEGVSPTNSTPAVNRQLRAMGEAVLRNNFARTVLADGLVEQIKIWTDDRTGLPCKALNDLWVAGHGLIADLKTTSARSYGEFLRNCEEYCYDRQAAFYLDGNPDADRFVILGVQKQAPYGTFYFEATACRGYMEGGRRKYRSLLRGVLENKFIPSSWQISPELSA